MKIKNLVYCLMPAFLLVLVALHGTAQKRGFIGEFDYPEVHLSLTIPTGEFGNDTYTPSSQQSGYAENGFAAGVAYNIGVKESIFGWYLNLGYRQMPHARFNNIQDLNPPLSSKGENGSITKQGQYIFISFLNGPAIQTKSGKLDLYLRGLFGPSYISGSNTEIRGESGSEYVYSLNGTVAFGRGGEIGLVISNNIRLGLSYVTYGTVQMNIQEGDGFLNSLSYNLRQPIDFWQLGLAYTWKKTED